MRYSLAILSFLTAVSAFPSSTPSDHSRRAPTAFERAQSILREKQLGDTFNATEQYVPTTGNHRFIAPASSDLRGPCPFLNAAANHGYIDRSGYTTSYEVVSAAVNVFGMGSDLATFFSSYAAIVHGDLTSFSIGGLPSRGQAALSASQHTLGSGLSDSHNSLEGDASPITSDVHSKEPGSTIRIQHLQELFDLHQNSGNANYDIPTLTDFRAHRLASSISSDKSFFASPFTSLVMQPASYSFMYRLLANHSADAPAGFLSQDIVKSFYAITTDKQGKMKWTPGHERIPDGWHRRSTKSPYDNHFLLNDALYQASSHPEFFRLGGNVGKRAGNFRPVDVKGLTGGVYRAATLHQDWNFACLGYQAALKSATETIGQHYYNPSGPMNSLYAAADPLLSAMACPRWAGPLDEKVFEWYPGARRQERNRGLLGFRHVKESR